MGWCGAVRLKAPRVRLEGAWSPRSLPSRPPRVAGGGEKGRGSRGEGLGFTQHCNLFLKGRPLTLSESSVAAPLLPAVRSRPAPRPSALPTPPRRRRRDARGARGVRRARPPGTAPRRRRGRQAGPSAVRR